MNREMIQRCKTDKEYLEKVMLENENLIWFSIRKYIGEPIKLAVHHRIEKDDLLQLGRLALLKAIKRFDPERGVKFSSFAVTAIVREVRCFLRDKTTVIRPTRSASQLLSKIKQTICELQYTPTTKDLACLLDTTEEQIIKVMRVAGDVVYAEFDLPETRCFENEIVDRIYVREILQDIAFRMTDIEMQIVLDRLSGMTYEQLSNKYRVSENHVVAVMRKAAGVLQEVHILMHEWDEKRGG